MLKISNTVSINDNEIELTAIRAQGAGGQNVNKVSSAIHLRFDILASSMPELYKQKLLNLNDKRINKDGVLIIKAQKYRTQDKNKTDAINRLKNLIDKVTLHKRTRIATKPSKTAKKKRVDEKIKRKRTKELRKIVID